MENMKDIEDRYYAKLYRQSRKGRNTIDESLKWLEDNLTGETRKAIHHKMDADSWKLTQELKLYHVFRSIIISRQKRNGCVS